MSVISSIVMPTASTNCALSIMVRMLESVV